MVPKLISFFGPDGAGKSTQVRILRDHLMSRGFHVRKVWIRSPHTLAFLLTQIMYRVGLYRVATNPFGVTAKQPLVNDRLVSRRLWAFIEIVSVMPLILFRVYLPLWFGYTLVAERYIADTIVTVSYFVGDESFLVGRGARLLRLFVPENTVFIFLDSGFDTILERRGREAEPREFIEFQRRAYHNMSKVLNAEVINTAGLSIGETSRRILTIIFGQAEEQRSDTSDSGLYEPNWMSIEPLGSRRGIEASETQHCFRVLRATD